MVNVKLPTMLHLHGSRQTKHGVHWFYIDFVQSLPKFIRFPTRFPSFRREGSVFHGVGELFSLRYEGATHKKKVFPFVFPPSLRDCDCVYLLDAMASDRDDDGSVPFRPHPVAALPDKTHTGREGGREGGD